MQHAVTVPRGPLAGLPPVNALRCNPGTLTGLTVREPGDSESIPGPYLPPTPATRLARRRAPRHDQHTTFDPTHRPPAVRRSRGAGRRRPLGVPLVLAPPPPRRRLVDLLPVPRWIAGRRCQGTDA